MGGRRPKGVPLDETVVLVDVTTELYQVARSYMIRLEPEDLEEPCVSTLAREAGLRVEQLRAFERLFAPAVAG